MEQNRQVDSIGSLVCFGRQYDRRRDKSLGGDAWGEILCLLVPLGVYHSYDVCADYKCGI